MRRAVILEMLTVASSLHAGSARSRITVTWTKSTGTAQKFLVSTTSRRLHTAWTKCTGDM